CARRGWERYFDYW
nr:immunoglobulin heavy chain junction region [Mus musculus]